MAQSRGNKKNQLLQHMINGTVPEEVFEPDTEEEALLEKLANKAKNGGFGGGSVSEEALKEYQKKTDNSLTTTAKTIVGAINEVKQTASTGVDAETITTAVDAYMEANPVGVSFSSVTNSLFTRSFKYLIDSDNYYINLERAITGNIRVEFTFVNVSNGTLKMTCKAGETQFAVGANTINKCEATGTVSNLKQVQFYNWYGDFTGCEIHDLKIYIDEEAVGYTLTNIGTDVEVLDKVDYPIREELVDRKLNAHIKGNMSKSMVIHAVNTSNTWKTIKLKFEKSIVKKAITDISINAIVAPISIGEVSEIYISDPGKSPVIKTVELRALVGNNFGVFYDISTSKHISSINENGIDTVVIKLGRNTEMYIYDLTIMINGEPVNYSDDFIDETGESSVSYEESPIASKAYVDSRIGGYIKSDKTLPFVNNIYTVGTKSSDMKFAVPIFLDYLYGEYKRVNKHNRITFDRTSVLSSNPTNDNLNDRMYVINGVKNKKVYNKKETVKLNCDKHNVTPLNFNNITIDDSLPNGKIHILTIGDSVTAGAITKKQYWSFAAEYFAKEDLYQNRTSDVLFLGTNNFRSTEVTANNNTRTVNAAACGISSWSLNKWLTEITDANPFTYTDSDGNVQFSIAKFVERYRNYTDDGVKLELGDSNLGTNITSNNIDKVICCTPTHLYINSTHNGGTIEEYRKIINIAKQEFPEIKIIVGDPMPLLGTWFLDYYDCKGYILDGFYDGPNYCAQGGNMFNRIEHLKHWVSVENNRDIEDFYIMPQNVITPTVEGYEWEEIDVGFAKLKKITGQSMPKEHPGTGTHKIWGYELYALLKFIQNENNTNATTNVVSVSLSANTASLTVGNTTTLTATPSDGSSTITFSSSDESVATVDTSGVVTAVATGECYIYAETTTSIFPANCKITVTE